ncbi:hypothetical protein D9M70_618970 [compost metagenome]
MFLGKLGDEGFVLARRRTLQNGDQTARAQEYGGKNNSLPGLSEVIKDEEDSIRHQTCPGA